eukprot:364366-Chlamydomonas_euryale.AAC.7
MRQSGLLRRTRAFRPLAVLAMIRDASMPGGCDSAVVAVVPAVVLAARSGGAEWAAPGRRGSRT